MDVVRFHIHAVGVCVGKERLQGIIQVLIDGDKSAEILDADLQIVLLLQHGQIICDFLVTVSHKIPLYPVGFLILNSV